MGRKQKLKGVWTGWELTSFGLYSPCGDKFRPEDLYACHYLKQLVRELKKPQQQKFDFDVEPVIELPKRKRPASPMRLRLIPPGLKK